MTDFNIAKNIFVNKYLIVIKHIYIYFNEELKYKTKMVRNKLGMKKRGREEGRSYGLIHPFL